MRWIKTFNPLEEEEEEKPKEGIANTQLDEEKEGIIQESRNFKLAAEHNPLDSFIF